MNFVERLFEKLTARNYLAIITSTALVFAVIYGLTKPDEVADAIANPLITYIMGQFGTVVVMVYVFYFRKQPAKESKK